MPLDILYKGANINYFLLQTLLVGGGGVSHGLLVGGCVVPQTLLVGGGVVSHGLLARECTSEIVTNSASGGARGCCVTNSVSGGCCVT